MREVSIQVRTIPVTTNMRQLSPVRSSFEGPRRWRFQRSSTEGLEMMPAPPSLDPTLRESRSLDHPCADFAAAVPSGSLDPVDRSSTAKHVSTPKNPSFGDASVAKSRDDASKGEELEATAASIPLQHNTAEKATKSPDMNEVRAQFEVVSSKRAQLHAVLERERVRSNSAIPSGRSVRFQEPWRCSQSTEHGPRVEGNRCILRPVSVLGSDLCNLSSPPCAPLSNMSAPSSVPSAPQSVRRGPTRVGGMGGGEAVESPSEWPSLPEPGIPRGRNRYTPATPIVPKDPPVAYKLEKGARVPVYESAAEGSKPEMTGRASSPGLGQTLRAARVEPPREPSSTLKEGVPRTSRRFVL